MPASRGHAAQIRCKGREREVLLRNALKYKEKLSVNIFKMPFEGLLCIFLKQQRGTCLKDTAGYHIRSKICILHHINDLLKPFNITEAVQHWVFVVSHWCGLFVCLRRGGYQNGIFKKGLASFIQDSYPLVVRI